MILIRVVSRAGEVPVTPLAATFGEAGGDIGRGADCTLVLPDPERRISRRHAHVACRGGHHFISQVSASSAVELDGVPLAPEVEHPLQVGAQIRIGPYLLLAERGLADEAGRRPERASVFSDLFHGTGSDASASHSTLRGELDLVIGEPTGHGEQAVTPEDPVEALFAGLGVHAPAERSAQQMLLIGALLRATLTGTLELLAARSIAKRELGASPTLLRTRENNPLKFSPDADAALAHLLGPPQRGFVPPLEAVADAFGDLRAHELALLAGMRSALEAVVGRLAPQALQERLAPQGLLGSMVPLQRKARLWEAYGEQHAQIVQEIEGDIDSLFDRAFRQAYEAQLSRLQKKSG
ncbi:MAG TPA: type VI secretion system-associated FHA domain protein TagH [Burkholderiaceae bacterium]|jgi:FHA domain-containing protein|nr:type VI secretion system-associated FHA domain protein TagH [Burkholderiaceae bacterium]